MANLSKQQEYLLNRLPRRYDVREDDEPEPAEVTKARKVIETYTEKSGKARKAQEARFNKGINAAREAVYFLPAEKALEVVKKFEAEFGIRKG